MKILFQVWKYKNIGDFKEGALALALSLSLSETIRSLQLIWRADHVYVHMQTIKDILAHGIDPNDVGEGKRESWNGKFHREILTI